MTKSNFVTVESICSTTRHIPFPRSKKSDADFIYYLVDAGLTSTVTHQNTLTAAKGIVNKLSEKKVDYIDLGSGDGQLVVA